VVNGRVVISEPFEQRMREIRRRDRARKVFGANLHQYRSTRVGPADVARFGAELGVAPPEEYATFLQRVGYGAGPYYGVWSPGESLAEIRDLGRDYERETGRLVRPALPFPLGTSVLAGIDARGAAGAGPAVVEGDWPCSGCVPICHQGCTFWSVLVLNGDFAGRVWDVACFEGYSGEWIPARRPPGRLDTRVVLERLARPPTFAEWFAGWLEQCEADVSAAGGAVERSWVGRWLGRGLGG
jgi:hypothetical protein